MGIIGTYIQRIPVGWVLLARIVSGMRKRVYKEKKGHMALNADLCMAAS